MSVTLATLRDELENWLLILADAEQPDEVRLQAVRGLRNKSWPEVDRARVAAALQRVLAELAADAPRVGAAVALRAFVDVSGVIATLRDVARDGNEPIELRYSAFTSIESAGPTSESIAAARALVEDETLGPSARSLLVLWRAYPPER